MAQQPKWQLGRVVEIRQETPTVKSLILDVPAWTAHLAGQHVDVRLTAEDGYQAQRSLLNRFAAGGHISDANCRANRGRRGFALFSR